MGKILFWIGAALPFALLPIPWWLMIIGVLIACSLPLIGSIVSVAAWIWAAVVVFSAPFSFWTILFILAGLFGLAMNISYVHTTFGDYFLRKYERRMERLAEERNRKNGDD